MQEQEKKERHTFLLPTASYPFACYVHNRVIVIEASQSFFFFKQGV